MKINVCNAITAEGTELECAIYTVAVLETFRMKQDMDKKKEVEDWFARNGDKTIEELMRMESEDRE